MRRRHAALHRKCDAVADYDIELAVTVDIGDRATFVGSQIERVFLEGDVVGTAGGPRQGAGQAQA